VKSLGRTCLLWFVLYLVIAALLGALVFERFPDPNVAAFGGLGAGFFVWVAFGYMAGVRTKGVEARQIRNAMEGGRPADGERVAVTGYISGRNETLESPITRTRCVAYEYKAIPPQNEQLAAWHGMALVPTKIEGPGGSVRILATPELEFEGEPIGSLEHRRNFREYLAKTTFVENVTIDFKRNLAQLREINTDDDGRIHTDIHGLATDDIDSLTLTEKLLIPGDRVVAFGKYSSARGGLVPDEKAIGRSIRILKGEPQDILRKVSRKRPFDLLMGCGCLLPVIVAAMIAIVVVPLAAIEQLFPEKDPSWTEVRVEKKVHDLVTRTGLMPEMGTPTIELDAGVARGKLTWRGKTSHFEHASATHAGEVVDLSLTGEDVALTARFRPDRTLQFLHLGDFTVPAEDVEIEILTVEDGEVRGRLSYLSPKNDPSLRVAFRARFP
jgi:hypothetical protein